MVPKCTLCKVNPADKNNSHIIPKFMSKRLFDNTNPRHSLAIDKNGKQQRLQDTPKENKILCSNCELRIEKLETYFAKFFTEINNLGSARRQYSIEIQNDNEILHCKDLDPNIFKLFIFSLVWRCSISNLSDFENFKLDLLIEEELRMFLNSNLKTSHSELMQSIVEVQIVPHYHFCITKPKNKTRGIFTAFNFAPESFTIFTVDYAIFFYTNDNPYVPVHKNFSNRENEPVRIILGDDKNWLELNKTIVNLMYKEQNKLPEE